MPFSAEELIVALILIVPGFISVNLIIHLFGTSQKFSEFEKSSWSLFFSFIIDSLFLWHHGLDTVEEIRGFGIIFLKMANITEMFLISITLSFLCALFLRTGIIDSFHSTVWLFSDRKNYVQSPWEISLRSADWIIVTSGKIEYFGWLSAYSTHDQKREIVLGNPVIICRNAKGDVSDKIPCGEQLIIPESKIDKVVVASYRKTRWEQIKNRYSQKTKGKGAGKVE